MEKYLHSVNCTMYCESIFNFSLHFIHFANNNKKCCTFSSNSNTAVAIAIYKLAICNLNGGIKWPTNLISQSVHYISVNNWLLMWLFVIECVQERAQAELWNKMKTSCSIEIENEIKIKCQIIYHDGCKRWKSVELVAVFSALGEIALFQWPHFFCVQWVNGWSALFAEY